MDANNENMDKWASVWIQSSISAKASEEKIKIMFDFIANLISENDLKISDKLLSELQEKITNAGETSFLNSEYAQQFPDYAVASLEGDEGLIDGFLDRLNGDADSDND